MSDPNSRTGADDEYAARRVSTQRSSWPLAVAAFVAVVVALGGLVWFNNSSHYTSKSTDATSVVTSPDQNPRKTP